MERPLWFEARLSAFTATFRKGQLLVPLCGLNFDLHHLHYERRHAIKGAITYGAVIVIIAAVVVVVVVLVHSIAPLIDCTCIPTRRQVWHRRHKLVCVRGWRNVKVLCLPVDRCEPGAWPPSSWRKLRRLPATLLLQRIVKPLLLVRVSSLQHTVLDATKLPV